MWGLKMGRILHKIIFWLHMLQIVLFSYFPYVFGPGGRGHTPVAAGPVAACSAAEPRIEGSLSILGNHSHHRTAGDNTNVLLMTSKRNALATLLPLSSIPKYPPPSEKKCKCGSWNGKDKGLNQLWLQCFFCKFSKPTWPCEAMARQCKKHGFCGAKVYMLGMVTGLF